MKPEPNAKRRASAKKGKGRNGDGAREYVGFYAPAGTKKAARKKLGGQTLTRFCLNALQQLIAGDAAPVKSFGDPLLTEAQAAALLGITRPTLRAKRIAGEVEYFELGERLIRYDPAYLREKFLAQYHRGPQEANGDARQ